MDNLWISFYALIGFNILTRALLISTLESEGVRDFIPYGQTIFKRGGLRSCPINVQSDFSKLPILLRIVSPSNIWADFSAHIFFIDNLLK